MLFDTFSSRSLHRSNRMVMALNMQVPSRP